jgi:hypothetical protein
MASTRRTWLWIVLGVMATIAAVVVAVVAGTAFELHRHVRSEIVATDEAERTFDAQRDRFAGQQPLVELSRDDERPTIHRAPDSARRVQLQVMRVLVYDSDEGRLTRADVPGWLLRLLPHSRMGTFGGVEVNTSRVTLDDLERHGPGLVLDTRNRGTRVLVWTE